MLSKKEEEERTMQNLKNTIQAVNAAIVTRVVVIMSRYNLDYVAHARSPELVTGETFVQMPVSQYYMPTIC